MKKLALLLIAVLTLSLFFSCGETPPEECAVHSDGDGDGRCDACGDAVEEEKKPEEKPGDAEKKDEITLISGGTASFQIVVSKNATGSTVNKAVDKLVDALDDLDIDVKKVTESESNAKDCEVLVGVPALRGADYDFDIHTLGAKGYAIKVINGKVLIVGGSDSALAGAIEVFTEEFLGIDKKTKELDTVVVKASQSVEEIQDDYRITSLSLDGEDMKGYTIAADVSDATVKKVAESIQTSFYERAGYWFPIVSPSEADKSIVIKINENTYTGDGFYINIKDGQLVIETEFPNKLAENVSNFLATKLTVAEGDVNYTSKTVKTSVNVRDITYEQFGAVSGDGKDDFNAFLATHEYANQWGHNVKAKAGGEYYFGKGSGNVSIKIRTDTDWNGCKLIFDDSNIISSDPERDTSIMIIYPDQKQQTVSLTDFGMQSLAKNTTKLDYAPGETCLLRITNKNKRQFYRYGGNADNGKEQKEIILVHADGTIDPTTPLHWDYDTITEVVKFSVNERQITVGNAKIETICNQMVPDYKYYYRNIIIQRSNAILTDVDHIITGELEGRGDPYEGIFYVRQCDSPIIRNCTFDAPTSQSALGTGGTVVSMGSYGLGGVQCNNPLWENVWQTDYRLPDGTINKNGAHCTDYCKNITLKDSGLSLFDAHLGTYNATVINSEIITLHFIGEGLFYIEGVTFVGGDYHWGIGFREDYGSSWRGEVIVKDCRIEMQQERWFSLFHSGGYHNDHDFGYDCYFPEKITVDGLTVNQKDTEIHFVDYWVEKFKEEGVDISIPASQGGAGGINPYPGCKELIIKNCPGIKWILPDTLQFKDMKVSIDGVDVPNWKNLYGLATAKISNKPK